MTTHMSEFSFFSFMIFQRTLHATVSVSIEATVGKLTVVPDGRNLRKLLAKKKNGFSGNWPPNFGRRKPENAEEKRKRRNARQIVKFHREIKGRFRKRVVLANVPSFRFSFRVSMRTYPRSGFRSGEHSNVPSFRLSFRGQKIKRFPVLGCYPKVCWFDFLAPCMVSAEILLSTAPLSVVA